MFQYYNGNMRKGVWFVKRILKFLGDEILDVLYESGHSLHEPRGVTVTLRMPKIVSTPQVIRQPWKAVSDL